MRFKILFLCLFLVIVKSNAQNSINNFVNEAIKKYFTTGRYFLKDTIKPISLIYQQLNAQLKLKYIYSTANQNNRFKLTQKEKRRISLELLEPFVWNIEPDTLSTIINTEGGCTILDSITQLSTKIEYKYSEHKITQGEYDSLKHAFPYIIYISKPIPIRRNRFFMVGLSSIGGGLMDNPCHIIIFKKRNKTYKEYINVNCK
ncbi:MAG: hypothetical protein HOP11_12705 [Saprospiraceae bacterium]|nr:hypothetical protein [Saprospiraceae bacterium]